MNSRLAPLLLVYGEGNSADMAPGAVDEPVEEALLRTTKAALEAMPRPLPPREAVEAVLRAAREANEHSPLAAVRTVFAGETTGVPSVEQRLLESTWAAVESLPRPAPPQSTVESVVRHAAAAARKSELEPLRRVVAGERPAPGDVEARLLGTTLSAVNLIPRPGPPAETLAAVRAAAADAARRSQLAAVRAAFAERDVAESAEEAVLRSTWRAVEQTPREGPPVETVAAVLAAARDATPRSLRRAREAATPRTWPGLRLAAYATAAFAFVGLVSVAVWTTRDGGREVAETSPVADEGAAYSVAPPAGEGATAAPADAADNLASTPAVTADAIADARRVAPRSSAADAPSVPPPPAAASAFRRADDRTLDAARSRPVPADVGLLTTADRSEESPASGLAGAPAVAPAWEGGADVRLLSLRLATLQQQNAGMEWEEPPTALGGREEGIATPPGLNAVGTRPSPARFQVRLSPTD